MFSSEVKEIQFININDTNKNHIFNLMADIVEIIDRNNNEKQCILYIICQAQDCVINEIHKADSIRIIKEHMNFDYNKECCEHTYEDMSLIHTSKFNACGKVEETVFVFSNKPYVDKDDIYSTLSLIKMEFIANKKMIESFMREIRNQIHKK